jgi:hypothetical protein
MSESNHYLKYKDSIMKSRHNNIEKYNEYQLTRYYKSKGFENRNAYKLFKINEKIDKYQKLLESLQQEKQKLI